MTSINASPTGYEMSKLLSKLLTIRPLILQGRKCTITTAPQDDPARRASDPNPNANPACTKPRARHFWICPPE